MSPVIINDFEVVPMETTTPREKPPEAMKRPPPTPEEVREIVLRHLERVKRVAAD